MIWEGPPASTLELHKTLDHLENNQIGVGDAAGDASLAAQSSMLLPFNPEDLADLPSPRAGLLSPTASTLPWMDLLPDSPTGPSFPIPIETLPAINSSHCSNPSGVDDPVHKFPSPIGLREVAGRSFQDALITEQPSCTLPEWSRADAPGKIPMGQMGTGSNSAPSHAQWVSEQARKFRNEAQADRLRVNPLEGFNPYASSTSCANWDQQNGVSPNVSTGMTSSAAPFRADAPSPPLRLSLQQQSTGSLQAKSPLPGAFRTLSPSHAGRGLKYEYAPRPYGNASRSYGDAFRRPPRTAGTPPGCGSRVISGCMTSAAMAAHEDLVGAPLLAGQRTRSISAPIVRQGPAILRSKTPHKRMASAGGLGESSSRFLQAGERKFPTGAVGGAAPSSPMGFQEPRRCSEPTWMPPATSGLSGQDMSQQYQSLNELELSTSDFPCREGSLSWGTVEAIAAGYVPGIDGSG